MRRLLVLWSLVLVAGCTAPHGAQARPAETRGFLAEDAAVGSLEDVTSGLVEAPAMQPADSAGRGVSVGKAAGAERMLVHRGEIEVEVARTELATAQFLEQVVAWGGHLQQQRQQAQRDVVTLVVRVPAQRFDEAFALLRAAGRVLAESRQAEDVTEEFLDLGIRIDNARKSRERLLEVLAKATKVEEVLAVERELHRLTEEIERMEGRRKYLADRVALATIEVSFRSIQTAPPPVRKRRPSRFDWINSIGPRTVLEGY